MATITKVRSKHERVSALRGCRMRWYMQSAAKSLRFVVRRIAHSAGVPSGTQPGHAPVFGPAASPGGRECRRHPGMTLKSWDVEVQR
jgi:hypothetical protein